MVTFAQKVTEITRNEAAEADWEKVYGLLSEEKPGLLGAMLARAEAQVLRLSVIYALLDKSARILPKHLQAALAVWEYCEKSAVYIFGERLGDPTADRILDAIRTAGPQGMTDNDIYELFGRHKPSNERVRALTMLMTLGLICAEREETGGRPRTVWRAA